MGGLVIGPKIPLALWMLATGDEIGSARKPSKMRG
jgi:hypothetical protein